MATANHIATAGSETRAVNDIARLHQPTLLRRAQRLTGDRDDAQDLVQDTFERAIQSRAALDSPRAGQWLGTVMRHLFIDGWRREAKRPRHPGADVDTIPVDVEPPSHFWETLTMEEIVAAAAKLPAPLEQAFHLHYTEGLDYGEIARRLGVRCGTIASRLFRARRRLQTVLIAEAEVGGRSLPPSVSFRCRPIAQET